MRLIDADALMKIAQEELDEVRQCEDADSSEAYPMLYTMALISTAHTIEAEPVRYGRWLPQILLGQRAWDCSECKTLGSPQWRWCPVCGAKMDAEDGEN